MAGPKDILSPEKYEHWLKQHRVAENRRIWKIKNEENPIKALPLEERGELPQTFSVLEAFWHPTSCECGGCIGDFAQQVKQIRLDMRPIPPAVKSATSRLPALPSLAQRLLRVAVEEALSSQD